jgi:hypothetical protein
METMIVEGGCYNILFWIFDFWCKVFERSKLVTEEEKIKIEKDRKELIELMKKKGFTFTEESK